MFGLSDYINALDRPLDKPYPMVYAGHYANEEWLGSLIGKDESYVFDVLLPFAFTLDVTTSVLVINNPVARTLRHAVIHDTGQGIKTDERLAYYEVGDRGQIVISESHRGMWSMTRESMTDAAKAMAVIREHRPQVKPLWTYPDAMMVAMQWRT